MEQNFEILESQIRDSYGRALYTHKTHEKCADIADEWNIRLKYIQIILSGLSATGIMYTIWGEEKWVTIICAVLSAILFIINIFLKNIDYGKIAEKHRDAAIDIWDVKESYLSLLTDMRSAKIDYANAIIARDNLQAKLTAIYKCALRTNSRGYKKAQEALKKKEEATFSDEEIDLLLPIDLRRMK